MAIGLSGLVSGLDTDAIVKAMVEGQNMKKTKINNKIQINKWTTSAWSEMNTKIYSFYTQYASKLRLKSSYQTRSASSSDDTKIKATASQNASIGNHRVKVKSLASSQFVTGGKLGTAYTLESKMSAISSDLVNQKITITNKAGSDDETKTEFTITEDMTVNEFLKECKNSGISASYDITQRRFFFSSGDSGTDNKFTISSTQETSSYKAARENILSKMDTAVYDALSEADKQTYDQAVDIILNADSDDVQAVLSGSYDPDSPDNTPEQVALYSAIIGAEALMKATGETQEEQLARDEAFQQAILDFKTWDPDTAHTDGDLSSIGLAVEGITGEAVSETTPGSMVVVKAEDAEIVIDGATMKSASNTIVVNGLTMQLEDVTYNKATGDYDEISVTVGKNTEDTYKLIQDALKAYNELIDEMGTLYNAKSARGYDPLTAEQKEAMTEEDIKNWEDKIKSALLRRDSTLGSLISSMRTSLNSEFVDAEGNKFTLSSFGIVTGSYTENGKLHIYGDESDPTYATYTDRLKTALDEDPDKVMNALSGIFSNLYSTLSEKCAKTELSSALTFYNDKYYAENLDDYEKELTKMEDKINDLTDKYYKQFTAMEKAMSQLQSKQASLASMLGQNTQQ